jgi:hypothetical protein
MKRLLKPLWIALALVFIFEAWLWEKLEPIVARIVALVPLHAVKAWIVARIEGLSPPATLIVFVVPPIVLFPIKIAGLWLLAHGHWILALGTLVLAKLAGVGVAAFIFDATKPKLLRMNWFRWCYETVLAGLAWAHALADPYIVRARELMRDLKARLFGDGDTLRIIRFIRERVRGTKSV